MLSRCLCTRGWQHATISTPHVGDAALSGHTATHTLNRYHAEHKVCIQTLHHVYCDEVHHGFVQAGQLLVPGLPS